MKSIRNYELRIRRVTLADAGAPYGEPVREPADVARIAQILIGDAAEERFIVIHLDVKNRVLGFTEAGCGSIDSCPVDPRTVFRTAVALGASGIVAAHCHPSGDPAPSREDLPLTKRLAAAGELLGIQLLDHVIVLALGAGASRNANARAMRGGSARSASLGNVDTRSRAHAIVTDSARLWLRERGDL